MTLKALDSAYPPSDAQIAAAKAAGYAGWNGYFAGQNILNGWSDGDFKRVLAGGLGTLAFCSGWADPTAMKIRGAALGIPIMADVEGGIRGDGPWLQPWLDASSGGLYANYWVFSGKRASRYMLAAYPSSGDPFGASWSTAYGPRPAGLCGWQWAGSHGEFGRTVDSEWLDDGYYPVHGAASRQSGDDDMLYVSTKMHPYGGTLRVFTAGVAYRDPSLSSLQTGSVHAGSMLGVDGYIYSSSYIDDSSQGATVSNHVWWHVTSGQWVPDAYLDTVGLAGAPAPAVPAGEPLSSYFAIAGQGGGGADDDSQYATKADLQAVKDAIPTKASGSVTLTLGK